MDHIEMLSALVSHAVTHDLDIADTFAVGSPKAHKRLFHNTFRRSGCFHCKAKITYSEVA